MCRDKCCRRCQSYSGCSCQGYCRFTGFLRSFSYPFLSRFFLFCVKFRFVRFTALPHIVPFEVDEDINFGDSVQMNCHVSKGDMPIKIHWLHNGLKSFSNAGITVQKLGERSSVLTISNVKAQHRGNFTCMASNKAGIANFTIAVHVKGTFIQIACFG